MRNETTTRFARLIERHQDMAFATALSALGHVQQAEDAAQEAFVEAYLAFPRLRAPEAFTSWFQVILRRSIARVRTRSWYTNTPLAQEKGIDLIPQVDLRLEVTAALSTLPPAQREAIILHYIGGYTAPELAEQLGLPLTTIKKRLADARRTLRKRMDSPQMEETIKQAAPSANTHFTNRVLRLIQPESLKSDAFVAWSGGIGTAVWSLFRAAMTGDLAAVQGLLAADPTLVHSSCDYRTALHFAVRENQLEVVRCLLEAGADATRRIGRDSPLSLAQERGFTAVAALLEQHLAQKHQIDSRSETLTAAIRQRDTAAAVALLDSDPALLSLGDERGNQAIHWATMTRNPSLIDLLLERGADINAARPDGARPIDLTNGDYFFRGRRDVPASTTPTPEAITQHLLTHGAQLDLASAARLGDLEAVQALLASHSPQLSPSGYCTYYSGTPLRNAAERGHLAVVQLLLAHGADPNEPEPGIAPFGGALYAAAASGHHTVAQLLLEHGANPSQTMESSGSALSRAKSNKDQKMIELLASYGGITGFAISCYYNDLEVLAAMLWANPRLAEDTEALGYAVSEGHVPLTKLLLRHSPETAKRLSGEQAATPELLTLLLDHGLDPNFVNWLGVTALHHLAAAGALDRASLLIERGATLDVLEEESSSTPLAWAAREGKGEMVRFLLERGASLTPPGQPDWAHPRAWAQRRGHTDSVREDVWRSL